MRVILTRRTAVELALLVLLLPLAFFGLRWASQQYIRAAYPLRYTELVEAAAEEYGVSPSLIYAVIHTESGFETDAVSSAGARGLMQITQDTFLWAQSQMNEPSPLPPDRLHDPAVGIRYGVYILSFLREQFTNADTVLAAYNAGLGRVRGWLQNSAYSPDGKTLAAIPYSETERYVQKVNVAREWYQKIYKME